jgi:hypothetical protein
MTGARWETAERKKILLLVNAVPAAIKSKDAKRILEIYDTYNPMFCTFEDDPRYSERVDGRRFRKFIGGLADLESTSIDRRDVRVDLLSKNVAVVTGMDDWKAKLRGKTTKARSRFTIVFWKKGGWKVIHEHFTRLE